MKNFNATMTMAINVTSTKTTEEACIKSWLPKKQRQDESEVEPLVATLYSLSQTGNLTIMFSKPIIKPPIEVHEVTEIAEDKRRLADLVPISRLVSVTVESDYYGAESN